MFEPNILCCLGSARLPTCPHAQSVKLLLRLTCCPLAEVVWGNIYHQEIERVVVE